MGARRRATTRMARKLTTVGLAATAWLLLAGGTVLRAAPPTRYGCAPAGRFGPPDRKRPAETPSSSTYRAVLDRYCLACHNDRTRVADLTLESADLDHVGADAATWEKVLVKLRAQTMPPPPRPRPDAATYTAFAAWLETAIDRAAEAAPDPGRPTVRRLNRAEYANAVRDLLAVEVDGERAAAGRRHGLRFRQQRRHATAVGGAPRALPLGRGPRLAAGDRRSRRAPGHPELSACRAWTPRPRAPARCSRFGSRGGTVIRHHFPVDGEYIVRVHSQNSIGGGVRPPSEPEQLEVRLDGVRLRRFTARGAASSGSRRARGPGRPPIPSGPLRGRRRARTISAVTFMERLAAPEGVAPARLPVSNVLFRGAARRGDARGPHRHRGPVRGGTGLGDTPSRRRILTCRPDRPRGRGAVRPRDPRAARAPRLPPAGHRTSDLDALLRRLPRRTGRGGELRARHPLGAREVARSTPTSCTGWSPIRWTSPGGRPTG